MIAYVKEWKNSKKDYPKFTITFKSEERKGKIQIRGSIEATFRIICGLKKVGFEIGFLNHFSCMNELEKKFNKLI